MLEPARLQRLITRLHARAQPPLPTDLIEFHIAGACVGDALPAVARFVAQRVGGFVLNGGALAMSDDMLDVDARTARLAEAALKLHEAGLITGWRNELLSVGTPPIAAIERAACRALGITTEAVHLNAYVDERTLLVARRSAHKQIDPGLWDNLVGGMVPAGESLQQALKREAWEEAGLEVDRVTLQHGRWFQVRRPVPEGLQSEIIHVCDALLPAHLHLKNQDGEVEAIERRSLEEVIDTIEHDEFTLESALATLESLTRRDRIDTPAGLFHMQP